MPAVMFALATDAIPATVDDMIVIRRLVDAQRAYTVIFLPGEEPRVFPTNDYEHGRILQIYKQDRPYEGIINDFSDAAPHGPVDPGRRSPTHRHRKK
jgi:hypothetical protein